MFFSNPTKKIPKIVIVTFQTTTIMVHPFEERTSALLEVWGGPKNFDLQSILGIPWDSSVHRFIDGVSAQATEARFCDAWVTGKGTLCLGRSEVEETKKKKKKQTHAKPKQTKQNNSNQNKISQNKRQNTTNQKTKKNIKQKTIKQKQ